MTYRQIAQYEILEQIGRGGMGVVYKARDRHLGRLVAIKVLPPLFATDPERRSRFLREAQAAANLNHPHIATVYQFGPAEVEDPELTPVDPDGTLARREVLFLAMEFIEGEDLQARLADGPMDPVLAFGIAAQVASGLEAAHRAGVVHRDLKPNNIRITPEGQVKILDFGLAKVREENLAATSQSVAEIGFHTTEGMLLGTPPYMAPEQLRGSNVDHRSDLFSLGVVLYQLLAGKPPWPADNLLEYVKALSREQPPPLRSLAPKVSEAQQAVVHLLLASHPEDRFASATEARQAIESVAGNTPPTAVSLPLPSLRALRAGNARRALRRNAGIALGALLVVVTALLVWRGIRGPGGGERGPWTLAIRAFENLTGVVGYDFLSKKIPVNLLDSLGGLEGIRLFNYLTQDAQAAPARTQTGTDAELEGYIDSADGNLRLTLALKQTEDGLSLWSQRYEGDLNELEDQLPAIGLQLRALLAVLLDVGAGRPLTAKDFGAVGERLLEDINLAENSTAATPLFDLAVQQNPKLAAGFAGRSITLQLEALRRQDPKLLDQAEQDADEAVRLAPNDAWSRLALGRLYRIRGGARLDDAIEQLQLAADLPPQDPQALLELSIAFDLAGRREDAVIALRRALELRPGHWDYLNQLGKLHWKKGEYEAARQAFEESARNAPVDPSRPIANLVGMALFSQENPREALRHAERLPRPIMESALVSNLGSAHYQLGEFEQAEQYFERALELDPRISSYYRNLADALERQGRDADARSALEGAVRVIDANLAFKPDPIEGARRSLYLAKLGDCTAALAGTQPLRPQLGTEPAALAFLAQAHGLCKDVDTALSLLAQAIAAGYPKGFARTEKEFEGLRGDPRFAALTTP